MIVSWWPFCFPGALRATDERLARLPGCLSSRGKKSTTNGPIRLLFISTNWEASPRQERALVKGSAPVCLAWPGVAWGASWAWISDARPLGAFKWAEMFGVGRANLSPPTAPQDTPRGAMDSLTRGAFDAGARSWASLGALPLNNGRGRPICRTPTHTQKRACVLLRIDRVGGWVHG
jgi:hypothetical protein